MLARAQARRKGQKTTTHAHTFFGSRERQSAHKWRAAQRRPSRLRRASGPPEPPHDSCHAAAPPPPLWSPPCSSTPPESEPQAARGSTAARKRPSIVAKTAGGGEGDNGDLAADDGGDGGRATGAELRRNEHGGALKWVKVLGGPRATAECFRDKVRSGALKGGGTRLSALHKRSPQPYLHMPRMYVGALAARRPASRANAARRDPGTRRVRRAGAGTELRSALERAHAMGVPAPCSLRA